MLVFGRGEEEGVVDPKNIFLVDPRGGEKRRRREERKRREGGSGKMCVFMVFGAESVKQF